MSVASRTIFSNFFEEQSTQNHPQYLSGLSRALFPTTFLEIALYVNAMLIPYLIESAVNIFKLTHFIKGNLNAP